MTEQELLEFLHAHFHYNSTTGQLWRTYDDRSVRVGSYNTTGYLICKIKDKMYLVHRLIWLMVYGKFPYPQTDHINRIRDDNRIANLRQVTAKENSANKKQVIRPKKIKEESILTKQLTDLQIMINEIRLYMDKDVLYEGVDYRKTT